MGGNVADGIVRRDVRGADGWWTSPSSTLGAERHSRQLRHAIDQIGWVSSGIHDGEHRGNSDDGLVPASVRLQALFRGVHPPLRSRPRCAVCPGTSLARRVPRHPGPRRRRDHSHRADHPVRALSGRKSTAWRAASSASAVTGPLLGPTIGGYLINWSTWHWCFLVNVPLRILAAVLCLRFIEERASSPSKAKIASSASCSSRPAWPRCSTLAGGKEIRTAGRKHAHRRPLRGRGHVPRHVRGARARDPIRSSISDIQRSHLRRVDGINLMMGLAPLQREFPFLYCGAVLPLSGARYRQGLPSTRAPSRSS